MDKKELIDWIVQWNIDHIKDCNAEAIRNYCEEQTIEYLQEHKRFIERGCV